jgi:cell division initiation protein
VLTPLDIQKIEFKRAFRGYSEDEVDAFLDLVVQDYENLIRENQELREKVAQTEQSMARYREIEEAIKNTMVMAQKNTSELRQNAEKEAVLLLDRTRLEADQLTREAEREAASLMREAEKKLKQVVEEYHRIQSEARIFKVRFRSLLEAQVKALESEEEELFSAKEWDGRNS